MIVHDPNYEHNVCTLCKKEYVNIYICGSKICNTCLNCATRAIEYTLSIDEYYSYGEIIRTLSGMITHDGTVDFSLVDKFIVHIILSTEETIKRFLTLRCQYNYTAESR